MEPGAPTMSPKLTWPGGVGGIGGLPASGVLMLMYGRIKVGNAAVVVATVSRDAGPTKKISASRPFMWHWSNQMPARKSAPMRRSLIKSFCPIATEYGGSAGPTYGVVA